MLQPGFYNEQTRIEEDTVCVRQALPYARLRVAGVWTRQLGENHGFRGIYQPQLHIAVARPLFHIQNHFADQYHLKISAVSSHV